jgi:hypothetical protein
MAIMALAKLRHRSEQLTAKLAFGTATEVKAARELLRLSLIELYELGHWREQPDDFKIYMRLYRACSPTSFSVPESMSAPDRRDRCSP